MKLRVKYDELEDTGKYIGEKNEEIDTILRNIQKIIDKLDTAWVGEDHDLFVEKATSIINSQQEKRQDVGALSEMLTKVSGKYKTKDTEWEDKIKKEHVIDEYRRKEGRV